MQYFFLRKSSLCQMIRKIMVEPEEGTPKNKCLLSLITARQFCRIASLLTPVLSVIPATVNSEIKGTLFI